MQGQLFTQDFLHRILEFPNDESVHFSVRQEVDALG